MNMSQIEAVRHALPFLGPVPDEDWRTAELASVDPTTPHSIREGHLFRHALFVISGVVRVYQISPVSGREITLYRVGSGGFCVLMMASILGDTEYEASIAVETSTEVLLLPVDVYKRWLDSYKPVRQYIYKQMIERMISVTVLLERVAFQSIAYRVADYLLVESARTGSHAVNITHGQLGVELGSAREAVSRTLKGFAQSGAVSLSRGRIIINDRGLLEAVINSTM